MRNLAEEMEVRMRLCQLRQKVVINLCDGKRVGQVCDLVFEEKTGRILALIVPGPCKVFGMLGQDHEYEIPFCCVNCIGDDVILVEIDRKKCFHKCCNL